MPNLYGYIRTSRRQVDGEAGSDPETQRLQIEAAGVDPANTFRDVGVSGATGTNTRAGWRALNARLREDDVLVVSSVDRIGRWWIDTVNTLRDLRGRRVRLRSLSPAEQLWTRYLDAAPDAPEAMIGDILASVFAWAAQQELTSIKQRTKAGLTRARAAGKVLGRPAAMTELQVDVAVRMKREGLSLRQIGRAIGVSRTTVGRYIKARMEPGRA